MIRSWWFKYQERDLTEIYLMVPGASPDLYFCTPWPPGTILVIAGDRRIQSVPNKLPLDQSSSLTTPPKLERGRGALPILPGSFWSPPHFFTGKIPGHPFYGDLVEPKFFPRKNPKIFTFLWISREPVIRLRSFKNWPVGLTGLHPTLVEPKRSC